MKTNTAQPTVARWTAAAAVFIAGCSGSGSGADAGADSGMAPHPDLVLLTEGRWQARCQFCKRESIPIPGDSTAGAWRVLETLGWVPYESVRGAMPVALCKACGEKNARIMAAVAKAKKGRKRK